MIAQLAVELFRHEHEGRPSPYCVTVNSNGENLDVTVDQFTSNAIRFSSCRFSSPRLHGAKPDQLRRYGDGLATRVHYLLEQIRVDECDNELCQVRLRSSAPELLDGGRRFYEFLLGNGCIGFQRLHYCEESKQHTCVPMDLTREVFHRIVGDFGSCIV